jgi:hypothetical protein
VLYAQAILEVEIKNEDKDTDNEVFSDAKDGIFTNEDIDDDHNHELKVLRLRDVGGQAYNLPFQYARTWKVRVPTLHLHLKAMELHVHN